MGTNASVQGSSRTNVKKNGEPREPDEEDVSDSLFIYYIVIKSFVFTKYLSRKLITFSNNHSIMIIVMLYTFLYYMYSVCNK